MFTGGSGKAGRHAGQHLVDHGDEVLSIDPAPPDHPKARTLETDSTDPRQLFVAPSSDMGMRELDPWLRPQRLDAVVHSAAVPRIMITPDNELFRVNTLGTRNVIAAAVTLAIGKIVIASSETTYGIFDHEPADQQHSRWTRSTTSIPPTPMRSRKSATRRGRGPMPPEAAATSARSGSAT